MGGSEPSTGAGLRDALSLASAIPSPDSRALWGAGVQRFLASNDDMAADKDVELVYVSNVHTAHKDTVLPLMAAGKNVLCEKPLSVNAADTREMYEAADKSGKFFMAGLWSRFFPAQQK